MDRNDLKANPFYLSEEDISWVEKTRNKLTVEEKIGQLFCVCDRYDIDDDFSELLEILSPGSIMFRPMTAECAIKHANLLNKRLKVPPLISANLEKGGNGILSEGTLFASPLQIAATAEDSEEMAYKLGEICAKEASSIGANWAFAPIVDIDYNYRNPITNTRTFGSDPMLVKKLGLAYLKAVQNHSMAAAFKHFPGDGCDDRDQHLVTTINDLSCEKWDETYGEIYKAGIEAGLLTIMVGHIMQPAYQKRLNPALKDEELLPASLSKEIMVGLLRDKLGFNGLIATDATTMAGFNIALPRPLSVPTAIANGADVFLFTRNLKEDYRFMLEGYFNGIITEERLNDAVTRILATKASLGLHKKDLSFDIDEARRQVGCKEHKTASKECAIKAITLVKEEKGVLPLTKEKYRRILFCPVESEAGVVYSVKVGVCEEFRCLLQKEGFIVDNFVPSPGLEGNTQTYKEIKDNYDLIIYLANMATKSNQTTVRIEWMQPMGANVPIYINSIPTVFISVENPYHLQDVPRVKTYINAYSSHEEVLQALIDKLMGRSEFKGKSPVDAFCGRWDTKL